MSLCFILIFVFLGKLWSRSVKVAYNLLHKLGSKQEPLVRAGDRVSPRKQQMYFPRIQTRSVTFSLVEPHKTRRLCFVQINVIYLDLFCQYKVD